jgi:hypothetical protein
MALPPFDPAGENFHLDAMEKGVANAGGGMRRRRFLFGPPSGAA